MCAKNPLLKSITEIAQQLHKGITTTDELLKMCLQRIDDIKPLNAFITVNDLLSRKQSSAKCNSSRKNHVLKGIPIAVKDNFCTKNMLTTCASKMLSNFVPPYNATVVQKLENSGAVIIGKTNMDEFALGSASINSFYGPVKNVWRSKLKYHLWKRSTSQWVKEQNLLPLDTSSDDFFISGGSSGGSAVAVASGCCFGALASDTGGSTRVPASKCGVIGLKPTYGLLSRHGLIPLSNSLDAPSIMTRTVDDATLLLNCMQGWDPYDSTTSRKHYHLCPHPLEASVKGLHIGIPKEYNTSLLSPEVFDLWMKVAGMMEDSGAKVSFVSLPHTDYSIVCYSVLNCCDVASNFARYDGIKFGHRSNIQSSVNELFAISRHEGFGDVVRGRILAGNYFLLKMNYEKYFIKAAKVRRLICEDFKKVFNLGVDLLLTPVTSSDAALYSEWIKKSNRENVIFDDYFTQPVNLAGLPAVSVPCKLSKKGLPLSLQLIGQSYQESTMLAAAKWIETNVDFPLLELDTTQSLL